jgi:hypothetical protein
MGTTEKQGQPGQPGHDRDKDRQGQQQQEPGRNPQPGGGGDPRRPGRRLARQGNARRNTTCHSS